MMNLIISSAYRGFAVVGLFYVCLGGFWEHPHYHYLYLFFGTWLLSTITSLIE